MDQSCSQKIIIHLHKMVSASTHTYQSSTKHLANNKNNVQLESGVGD